MLLLDLKLLWRDWRGGQLSLVISALALAVTVVTAVSLLANRIERGLNDQVSAFLAADLAVSAGIPISSDLRDQAEQAGLDTALTANFVSMLFADASDGARNQLTLIKAVEPDYPLEGQLELAESFDSQQVIFSSNGPPAGEAWVEPRLLTIRDLAVGGQLEIGYSSFKITRLVVKEPDRGTGFASASPRVLINYADLPTTGLIRPGSRVRHRLLIAGQTPALQDYRDWFDSQTNDNQATTHYELQSADDEERQLGEALQRGRAFLLLSGTIGVLLAGLAMALASRRYAERLTDQVALMKAWGVSAAAVRRSQLMRLLVLTLVATCIGLGLGWLMHLGLLSIAKELFDAELPQAGLRPYLVAISTGFVCVLAFTLPALWHLPGIAPLRVLRRDLETSLLGDGARAMLGVLALFGLAYWYSQSWFITLMFFAGLLGLFAICALIAMVVLRLVKSLGAWRGSFVRLGLANLWRRREQTLIQLVGFSLTLMLLLVVTGLRTNLIAQWQAQLPEDTPTHFVFNVANQDLDSVTSILHQNQVSQGDWYPMVRGRLTAINDEVLSQTRLARSGGLNREVSLTQSAQLPDENQIIEGQWWQTDLPGAVSMEQEVALEIGAQVGDKLTFSVGGIAFNAELKSLRSVNWQSRTPNFYIIFSPGTLDDFAPNWLSGVRHTDATLAQSSVIRKEPPFVSELVRAHPTTVVLPLGGVVERIRDLIDKVTRGLEMILLLVLACGALVLFAAIAVSYDERQRENAILRTLGSSRKIVFGALGVEFLTLGAIAGLLASIGAEVVLYFMQTEIFQMTATWHPQLWLLGTGGGMLLISTLGLLRSRSIVTTSPLQSLRQIT